MRLKFYSLFRLYRQSHSTVTNTKYSSLFRPHELYSREYPNAYYGKLFPLESVSLIQKYESYEMFFSMHMKINLF